jgi:hypothetical protein
MLETHNVDVNDLHEATGYRVADVNRYVNAYHGFRQSRNQRTDMAESDFSLFQEAVFASGVAGRSLSTWLGWNSDDKMFHNLDNLNTMLELLKEGEDGGDPRINGALELRNKFSKLLAEPSATVLAAFLAGEISLDDADARRKEQAAVANVGREEASLDAKKTSLEDAFEAVDALPIGKIRRAGRQGEFHDLLTSLAEVTSDTIRLVGEETQADDETAVR